MMRARHTVRLWLTVSITIVAIAASVVRGEHIHPAGLEGRARALVHTHQIQAGSPDGIRLRADHGNHGLAIFVTSVFESAFRSVPASAAQVLSLPGKPRSGNRGLGLIGVVCSGKPSTSESPPSQPSAGRSPPCLSPRSHDVSAA